MSLTRFERKKGKKTPALTFPRARQPLDRAATRADCQYSVSCFDTLSWIVVRVMALLLQFHHRGGERTNLLAKTASRRISSDLRRRGTLPDVVT